eukprot:TRINITY_DN9700_c0_g1_i1.p1 TRINITY_DN9700_c0_g1~~TRINITY_DN9700_c0_g1_i1.p1  ORF type:complete len:618 (-),score=62.16 TRINITY_DN9700_c0_g1_i1:262-1902(-)
MTHLPAGDHPPGEMRHMWEFGTGRYMGAIPEARHTYNVIGNMNEYQVSLAETTFDGVESLAEQPGAIMEYYSLMWVTLQRVRTAREAISMMDSLTREYGYASTGESFSISDPNEAWVMDFIGRGPGEKGAVWVARRIPDGYVGAHANQARITTFDRHSNDTLYSSDIVEFAKRKGLYPKNGSDADFSFADVFDPVTSEAALSCEARVWDLFRQVSADSKFEMQYLDYVQGTNLSNRMPLFVKVGQPLSINTTMWLMRSHYEGSWFDARSDLSAAPFHSPNPIRPENFEVGGKQYMLNRAVGYMGTFFHFVAHARGDMPGPSCAGGIIWFGVDDSSLSVRTPMYSCTRTAPVTWAFGNGDTGKYVQRSAFWAFNVVANFAYSRYDHIGMEVQRRVVATERRLLAAVAELDGTTADLVTANESKDVIEQRLSDFSIDGANALVDDWVAFFPELFVKYRDYLVAAPAPPPASPRDRPPPPECNAVGYDASWYARIASETGDRYLVPTSSDPAVRLHGQRKVALLARKGGAQPRSSGNSAQRDVPRILYL